MTNDPYAAEAARYDSMDYPRCGRWGLRLPRISLGLWQNFGGHHPLDRQRGIILAAFDMGITHFDLANNYGPPPGSAETNFGGIFARDLAPYRDEIIVSTKAGYYMHPGPYGEWGSRKYLLSSLDASLSRMGLDYVDVFYHHRPDPDTPIEESMMALDQAVRSGKALYAGISNYGPAETEEAARILAELGTPLLIHQFKYSMYERTPEDGLLDALDQVGAGSIVFSPLAQGMLTDRYLTGIPAGSRITHSQFLHEEQVTETYLARTSALNEIAAGRGQSLAQLALQWVLRGGRVTSALVGASSVAQLKANVAALDFPELTEAEIAAIEPHAVHGTYYA
ncbi:aldo/keto reductase [Demequina sp. SYSU T00039]|uniref:Aldo/keto reductase n=1 Tax=Demequina lignilytica TaxID=3051663 RepID=A0AAW7M9D8_9MICO|nr:MULTISPECIES: aldo/keto reductase [unclassified Demequina]MDN4477972.1 aldo/keto reductase [Demequina sp. SYSU T00039-1]MDN4487881.1 aldo/keto reductase [Demequina sp. SYSU T00039]MDN4490736.1 aldo/keto reductase [Demequina sp. SYSU T00068]